MEHKRRDGFRARLAARGRHCFGRKSADQPQRKKIRQSKGQVEERYVKVSNIHVDTVIAGRIRYYIENWKQINSDANILSIVKGYHIEFYILPVQYTTRETRLCKHEGDILDEEIIKLWKKGVIELTSHSPGEFISTVFLRPKKTGSHRMILSLSDLNLTVEYNHFKLERLEAACRLMIKGCFLASIDLPDAYYSVNI